VLSPNTGLFMGCTSMSDFMKTAAAADLWIELMGKQASAERTGVQRLRDILTNRLLMAGAATAATSGLGYHKYRKGADGQSRLDKEVALANKTDELRQETLGKKPGAGARLRNMHQQLAAKNPALMAAAEGAGAGGLAALASHMLRKAT
jgi:hypothetical protein